MCIEQLLKVNDHITWSHMGRHKENAGQRRYCRGIISKIGCHDVASVIVIQTKIGDSWINTTTSYKRVATSRLQRLAD